MFTTQSTRGGQPHALDVAPIAPEDGARFVALVDRLVAADRAALAAPRCGGDAVEPVSVMAQHPRTPRAFWDEIGWSAQIGAYTTFDGALLKGDRLARGLSQEALAALIGVDRTAVTAWEAHDILPAPISRQRLAEVFAGMPGEVRGGLD